MDGYFAWDAEDAGAALAAAFSFFEQNGYAVLTAHATPSETAALRSAAAAITHAFHQSTQKASVFSTDEQTRVVDDDYFLSSSTTVRCFLEPQQQRGAAHGAVNKIGHALHDVHEPFKSFSRSAATRALASAFGFERALLVQSMYILKNARVGAAVNAHRDATFVYSERASAGDCLGLWWALQPSTLQNGCLWVVPQSHRGAAGGRRMVVRRGATAFDGAPDEQYDDAQFVALPMGVGDVVVLHGGVVHRSLPNASAHSRHAYSIHLVRGEVAETCWLNAARRAPFKPL